MFELVKIEGGRIYFKTDDFFKRKALDGQAVKGQWNTYRVFLTLHSLQAIYKHLENNKEKALILNTYKQLHNHVKQLQATKELEDCEGDERLRPYQRVDVKVLKSLGTSKMILNQQRTGEYYE